MARGDDKHSFRAGDILKNPAIVDTYNQPFLMTWEWSNDTKAEDTAKVTNLLAAKGWLPYLMSTSQGGGMSGNTMVMHCLYRRRGQG